MKADKARSTVGRICPNGLLEINRQRIQQALQLRTHRPCPTCNGVGRLASEEMVCLSLLRRVEARAATGSIQGARIGLHPELADALQNHYRRELADLENEFDIEIEVIATAGLHRPDEKIEWQKREKPVPPPKPKQAAITFQPWDLASLEDEDDDEEEDSPRRARTTARRAARPRAPRAKPPPGNAAGAAAGASGRRRAPGENGNGGVHATGANDQAAPGTPGDDAPAETYLSPVLAGPAFVDEPADLFDEDDDEEDGRRSRRGAGGRNADGTVAAPGAPGTKKRRRRRRRRK